MENLNFNTPEKTNLSMNNIVKCSMFALQEKLLKHNRLSIDIGPRCEQVG